MKLIKIPRLPHFLEPFRLRYDGKYINIEGKNLNHPLTTYGLHAGNDGECPILDYDTTDLAGTVYEVKYAFPFIKEVTKDEIIIDLGQCKHHPFDRDTDQNEDEYCTICGFITNEYLDDEDVF